NYPNPFNPSTSIEFALPQTVDVSLKIYNIRGQLVKTLVDGSKAAGRYSLTWDGTDNFGSRVASGTYIYSIKAGEFVNNKKMVLLK
ncbi:MAG: T9SS type A sorting domain-containing protein, partial [Calditrichaeota bacterium]|nr:T9SS type A sorting domain-containing protein [Calditrichota bacterium]